MANDKTLQEVLKKVKSSITCSCLYALEKEFNEIGLTLQTTSKNRMVLCKIRNGRPFCESFQDDYIFIGYADEDKELSRRAIDCIAEFVSGAASEPAELKSEPRSWQNTNRFYGKIILVNEEVNAVANLLVD